MKLFYSSTRFTDIVVFDPFMGSGTTIGETLKIGGRAIGRDINPVSYLQVCTALTLKDLALLENTYHAIERDVADTISSYYVTRMSGGALCRVLYYFWVMQATCPICDIDVDLFGSYIFARHAYSQRNPNVQVVCPKCGALSQENRQIKQMQCSKCNHEFNATRGPVRGKTAECPNCRCEFTIAHTIRDTGTSPSYRMYAKLILKPDGVKEYHPVNEFDEELYQEAIIALYKSPYEIPRGTIEPGYNTNQVLNYGFSYWHQLFNARQLLCISTLANRIKAIEDISLRYAFTCLFSGVLEFNNMFASYKGEGTGAVRHMFYHHILKPERTPLEANLWGTPRSSGAFSTLFRSRLLRAAEYAREPFELALHTKNSSKRSTKVDSINQPLVGITNSDSFNHFAQGRTLYISCGDSATTDLPDQSVDLVVTDPPFFDNVHYSQLADFFFAWQKLILDDSPVYKIETTRSKLEVQNADATAFTDRLTHVLKETTRVLKKDGLLIFTYHHSRWEGWRSILDALLMAGFCIAACHPVKAELSLATPKHQAKSPINFDIIMVCRKAQDSANPREERDVLTITSAVKRAEDQIDRLRLTGWQLSRNDVGVMVMAQVISEISRCKESHLAEQLLDSIGGSIAQAIDRLYESKFPNLRVEV